MDITPITTEIFTTSIQNTQDRVFHQYDEMVEAFAKTDGLVETTHPALARMFVTPEKAQELIDTIAYQTGYKWEIHAYMGRSAQ